MKSRTGSIMDQQKTEFLALTDEALAAAAWQQRREALHGNRFAFGRAHELERELRRRTGFSSTLGAPLASLASARVRPWWRFWA
jgi:hypothetical protein